MSKLLSIPTRDETSQELQMQRTPGSNAPVVTEYKEQKTTEETAELIGSIKELTQAIYILAKAMKDGDGDTQEDEPDTDMSGRRIKALA